MPQIHTVAELEALYGEPSAIALAKEADRVTPEYRAFIEAAPFLVLATRGPEGLDCSPRGDAPGFVQVADERTLLIPDRRGNNRLDSLRNIVRDPAVALLFLIPGIGETIRVNGRAVISVDADLCGRFVHAGKAPRTVVVVTVAAVYFQCAKAIMRSALWDPARHRARATLPSNGAIVAALTQGRLGGDAYDTAAPQRLVETLY